MYSFLIINIFELLALVAGTIYITKYRAGFPARYFVFFLWLTFFVEIIFGWFPSLVYYVDSFSFLKGTLLEKNFWIYNIYHIINFYLYTSYFKWNINSSLSKKILNFLLVAFLISSSANLFLSNIFFTSLSSYTFIVGSVMFLLSISFYFFKMLKSDEVLSFNKTLPFYVAIGSLVYHLMITPIFIYDNYFNYEKNPDFVEVHEIILTSVNIFMYTCYTIGFFVCSRKNKSYS